MTRAPEASQALLAARRALEGMKRVILIQDWTWNVSWNRWVLCCSLTREQTGDCTVPVKTTWYFLVDTTYPWGTIKCYPAKQDGLVQTFPHQQYNGSTHDDVPWRDGDICLGTGLRILGRHDYDTEPYSIHQRLRWYVQRALDWLDAAAQGSLEIPSSCRLYQGSLHNQLRLLSVKVLIRLFNGSKLVRVVALSTFCVFAQLRRCFS